MLNLRCISILIILVFLWQILKCQTTIDLDYCQQKARENHPLGLGIEQLKEINGYKIKSINSRWLPSLNLSAQASYQSDVMNLDLDLPPTIPIAFPEPYKDQYKATLELNQIIYDGGLIQKQKVLQATSNNLNIQQLEVDLYKMRETVNQVYFSILLFQENQKLMELMYHEVLDKYEVVKSGVDNGVLLTSNLLVMQAEILKLEQKLDEIAIAIKNSLKILKILIKEDFSDDVSFTSPIEVEDLSIELNRPEHAFLDLQQKKIHTASDLTTSQKMPQLFAFSQFGYGRPGLNYLNNEFDSFYLVGIGLKWNLWDWNKVKNERQALRVQADMISNQKENLNKNLRIALQKVYGEIEMYEKYIEKDKKIIQLQSKVVQASSSQLDHGVITSTEYITEVNKKTQAQLDLETHKIKLIKAKIDFKIIMGDKSIDL